MSEQDWAVKRSIKLIEDCDNVYKGLGGQFILDGCNIEDLIQRIALALKQEREIATLEMEAKWKKIVWPTEDEAWAEGEQWEGQGTATWGFVKGTKWLKEYIESRRK